MNPATFLVLASLQSFPVDRPTETCPADVVAKFNDVDDALRHLDDRIANMRGNPKDKRHLREDLADAVQASQEARATACRASHVKVVVEPPPPPPARPIVVLTEAQTQQLQQAVRKEAFDDNRLGVLALGVRGTCVTAQEARRLTGELTFSRPRMDALRLLAPLIVDREDAYKIVDILTFDSDRREAREMLTRTATAPECNPKVPSPPYRM